MIDNKKITIEEIKSLQLLLIQVIALLTNLWFYYLNILIILYIFFKK